MASLLGGLLAIAGATPALSADLGGTVETQPGGQRPWTFEFTTYGWLAWIKGDLTVKGRPLEIDVSPDQLIDALDWSSLPIWMSYAEARNGRFSLFNDILYTKLAGSAEFAKSVQGRFATLALGGRLEADYEQAMIELGAGYEVWSNGPAGSTGRSAVDLIAGARYWHQEANVSAALNATLAITGPLGLVDLTRSGSRVVATSGSVDWVDPFVGARLRHDVAPGQSLLVRADIGGFGAGSEFTWQALAAYSFQMCVTERYSVDAYLGYRALAVDYSQGAGNTRYEYDAVQHGPVTGLTVRF
mgnify:CR=1 FL=1